MKTAQEAKANNHLNQQVRYPEGIMTRREWLKHWQVKGAHTETAQVPKVQYNRIKYNRMNWEEQKEYEKKMEEKKTEYRLILPDKTFYELSKTEYEHFNSLQLSEDMQTEKHDLENRIEAGIATEQEIQDDEQKELDFFNKYFK